MNEDLFEELHGTIPGARTRELAPSLTRYESRNVTFIDERFPVFWESAQGATVTDVDVNRYIDLTAAFGVANAGHSNPYVAEAIHDQAVRLMHAMGDVHPTEAKAKLLEKLASLAPAGLSKTFLASSGSEAVEAALKTAILATGKSAFAAYRNAYHGLSIGTLEICGIDKFRAPFAHLLRGRTLWLDYPRTGAPLDEALERTHSALRARDDLAALVVEPIQGRGGCNVPPDGYLSGLRAMCDELDILLILDEIYTGFGRTGTLFAAQRDGVVPDILCAGKALANGFPISATIAKPAVMDAWPSSQGEALHTSTYLGNPMGCAAALATIGEIERLRLVERAHLLGLVLASRLERLRAHPHVVEVRGRGMLWGVELRDGALAEQTVKAALAAGVIVLQAGAAGEVLSIAPPLVIDDRQLFRAIDILEACLP